MQQPLWRHFGETKSTSLNAFINTTLGGIAFGDVFHAPHGSCEAPTVVVQIGRRRLRLDKFLRAVDLEQGICRTFACTAPARPDDAHAPHVPFLRSLHPGRLRDRA